MRLYSKHGTKTLTVKRLIGRIKGMVMWCMVLTKHGIPILFLKDLLDDKEYGRLYFKCCGNLIDFFCLYPDFVVTSFWLRIVNNEELMAAYRKVYDWE